MRDLRVDYGDFVAVDDISLEVRTGEIFGVVGPNGAGKTSTFRVVATLMEPTYGEVHLAGVDALDNPKEARRLLGYMPDLAPVPSDLRAMEFLEFHAATHGIAPRQARRDRAAECLDTVRLGHKTGAWCHKLSRGETQRLVLAKTLLHRPRVLILDEPASGLDPLARRELRLTLQTISREGATILVSSHILSELAELCTSLCVMDRGRLLATGPAGEVRRQLGRAGHSLVVTLADNQPPAPPAAWLEGRPGVGPVGPRHERPGTLEFAFTGTAEEQADLLADLVGAGFRVRAFEEKSATFEEILVEVAARSREAEGR